MELTIGETVIFHEAGRDPHGNLHWASPLPAVVVSVNPVHLHVFTLIPAMAFVASGVRYGVLDAVSMMSLNDKTLSALACWTRIGQVPEARKGAPTSFFRAGEDAPPGLYSPMPPAKHTITAKD